MVRDDPDYEWLMIDMRSIFETSEGHEHSFLALATWDKVMPFSIR